MEKPFYTAAHQKGGSVWIQTLLDAANQEDRGLKWTPPPYILCILQAQLTFATLKIRRWDAAVLLLLLP